MMGTFLVSSPVMIVASMALIIVEIGPIGLVTPIFFVIGSIIQQKINTAAFALRRLLLQFTDKRSKAVNEFFEGIRVIKVKTTQKREIKVFFFLLFFANLLPFFSSVLRMGGDG